MAGAQEDPRRALLLDLYRIALSAVDGRRRMRAALAADEPAGPFSVLAIGKAAPAMVLGALDALGSRLVRGLVIAPEESFTEELLACPRIRCVAGGHPLPDARSLAAGEAVLAFARATTAGSRVLVLVSGGASALVEVPAPGVALDDLRRLNSWAQAAAIDVVTLNAMRSSLSLIKGGRLPAHFAGAEMLGFLISDVPDDDPAVIGSGLLGIPRGPPAISDWPGWLTKLATRAAPAPPASSGCRVAVIARLADALDAAEREAGLRGLTVRRSTTRLSGDAETAARRICHELAVGDAELHLWGGETVVPLPAKPGRGGRCQHLALAVARHIAGHPEFIVLAAGTDGQDGNSGDAGAIVDGGTLDRALEAGFDPVRCLESADSGNLLEAAGELIHTGPTGTNVADLVLAARIEPQKAWSM